MFPGKGAWRGVYTKDWTYARSIASDTERHGVTINVLYNRKDDPGQLNNLFGNPTYVEKQAELERMTEQWMKRFGDREYTSEDFAKAQKIAGVPWSRNYEYRPIDLLEKLEKRFG